MYHDSQTLEAWSALLNELRWKRTTALEVTESLNGGSSAIGGRWLRSTWHPVTLNEGLVFMTDPFSCALKKGGAKRMLSRSLMSIWWDPAFVKWLTGSVLLFLAKRKYKNNPEWLAEIQSAVSAVFVIFSKCLTVFSGRCRRWEGWWRARKTP